MPLEVVALLAVGHKRLNVPPLHCTLCLLPLTCVYLAQFFTLEVAFVGHEQVSHEALHVEVDIYSLLPHHQQALECFFFAHGAHVAQDQSESVSRGGQGAMCETAQLLQQRVALLRHRTASRRQSPSHSPQKEPTFKKPRSLCHCLSRHSQTSPWRHGPHE